MSVLGHGTQEYLYGLDENGGLARAMHTWPTGQWTFFLHVSHKPVARSHAGLDVPHSASDLHRHSALPTR